MTGQLEMFENGATPFAVRRVHPNSSQALRESAHELSQRAAAVLAVYRRASHPMTDRDVKCLLGFADMNAVRPRITELIESGLLRECGRVKDAVTGKMVRVVNNSLTGREPAAGEASRAGAGSAPNRPS